MNNLSEAKGLQKEKSIFNGIRLEMQTHIKLKLQAQTTRKKLKGKFSI